VRRPGVDRPPRSGSCRPDDLPFEPVKKAGSILAATSSTSSSRSADARAGGEEGRRLLEWLDEDVLRLLLSELRSR